MQQYSQRNLMFELVPPKNGGAGNVVVKLSSASLCRRALVDSHTPYWCLAYLRPLGASLPWCQEI